MPQFNPKYHRLLIGNLALSTLILLSFALLNKGYSALSLIVTLISLISTGSIIYLAAWLIFLPLAFSRYVILGVAGTIFSIIQIGLTCDFFLFKLFHYHINAMVLNIILSPDGLSSFESGLQTQLTFGAVVLLSFGFQFIIIKGPSNYYDRWKSKWRFLLLALLTIISVDKATFSVLSLLGDTDVISSLRVIPLYVPVSVDRWAKNKFDIDPDIQYLPPSTAHSNLKYPLNPLQIDAHAPPPNVVFIVVDTFRAGMISPQITPYLDTVRQKSIHFQNHFSGGNATRFGIFSLFYGLNGNYWFDFLNERKGPVLFPVLKQRGYQIGIFASAKLSWPEFRRTVFVDVDSQLIHDEFPGPAWKKDEQSAQKAITWLKSKNPQQPFFLFLFLDSPHQASYPPPYGKFKPFDRGSRRYLTIDPKLDRVPLLNDYKNSLYYTDMILQKVLSAVEQTSSSHNTITILTGDHGEEFFESGHFGHNNSFTKEQMQTFLLMTIPDQQPRAIKTMSSHVDITATLLPLLGVSNSPKDYSLGHNLLDANHHRTASFVCNWNFQALVTDKNTIVFSKLPDPLFGIRAFVRDTYLPIKDFRLGPQIQLLKTVAQENTRFYY